MANKSDDVRIALLEEVVSSLDRRVLSMEDFQREVVEKIDQKIQIDSISQIENEKIMVRIATSLESSIEILRETTKVAHAAATLANSHETSIRTIAKVATIVTLLISAAWSVFIFFVK